MAFCLTGIAAAANYGGGTGTADDPYQIWTPEQMNAIGAEPNDWDKHFRLMADIDLSALSDERFHLIGEYFAENDPNNRPFTGVLDGDGHTISRFTCELADHNEVGLFRLVSGEIRNLLLAGANINAPSSCNVGTLVGYLEHGVVTNCRVIDSSVAGRENVGGLVGKGGCEVTRVAANSRVYPLISKSAFTGSVSAKRSAGGLVGYNRTGEVVQSHTAGHVAGGDRIGGLLGFNESGYAGDCYAIVSVAGESLVGGLIGESRHLITNCYAAGRVVGRDRAGGLVGAGSRIVYGSFWDLETTGQSTSSGGVPKSSAQMRMAETFFFWNACSDETPWTIEEGDYPRLAWEGRPGRIIEAVHLRDLVKGTGGSDDPYLIHTAEELNLIALYNNQRDKHYRLMADIDLSVYAGGGFNLIWLFGGVFDGNHHTIANLTCRSEGRDWVGLFGSVYDGCIKDLTLANPDIDIGTGYGAGALAGSIWHATVSNCHVEGGRVSGSTLVGGLVGMNSGTISECHAATRVTGGVEVGGLAGCNDTVLVACHASGIVSGDYSVGGLVGTNDGRITGSFATGDVTGESHVGGLGGAIRGRLVTVDQCKVEDCHAAGSVSGKQYVGGLAGGNDTVIVNCYSTGKVVGDQTTGGLVASGSGSVIGSFWDVQTSGQAASVGGTGKTTTEMQRAGTFASWNACRGEAVWTIDDGNDYPRLWWERPEGKAIEAVEPSDLFKGGGTAAEPYLVSTADVLTRIGLYPCTWDKHFKLTADIDLSTQGTAPFCRIGVLYMPFKGVFDGGGHVIRQFRVDVPSSNRYADPEGIGLFGRMDDPDAEIRNLGLVNPTIHVQQGSYVGCLVGDIHQGTVRNCCVTGAKVVTSDYNPACVGALVGRNQGTVVSCRASGEVMGDYAVGGLIGQNDGAVATCYAHANVSGDSGIGGFVGRNSDEGQITRCYAAGEVYSMREAGGLVGSGDSGGIVGSFWDLEIAGQATSIGGVGRTTSEMKSSRTYLDVGWDFVGETDNGTEDIWWIDEGRGYPRLWWEVEREDDGAAASDD
jgi:hypothetical protein